MKKYLTTEIKKREVLNQYLLDNKVDGILFHSSVNRLWLSEFHSTEGFILYTKNKTILYLDGRYITAGKEFAKNIDEIKEIKTNAINQFITMLKEDLNKNMVKILGFESEYLTYHEFLSFSHSLNNIQFVGVNLASLRAIKTNDEINKIKSACAIGDLAIANVIKNIKVGMSEKDVEKIIINTFIDEGAEKTSFDTIVASGVRGAMPHGLASNKKIENNELITIDFGCIYQGFCSDTTRTIGLGNPSEELRKIYDIVYNAQKLGIAAVKPNVMSDEIDKICRDYIINAGYGEYFTHSTGHGMGIEVHEFPRVSPFVNVALQPGMIITVEPGIYIPELGGVRIEDDILVTESGYEVLTTASRELKLI